MIQLFLYIQQSSVAYFLLEFVLF